MKATETELLDLIAQEAIIDRSKLVREATLEDLGISSLDLISMLFELEEKYGVVIEEGDMPQMSTLGEMVDFLLGRINAEATA
ncbi:acyl carrier protein [Phenylobacterium soli]|uniref:Acyl carrier protein n=1 Tax=Phenylobacterium soli TaxID=2170551 RepID=A0A328AJ26_9CAUL|nr:phosphopantetheine-binding protein [Phenylobacterium soli]RAK54780.1 acyl carrier protein [Phenylobacterium soli]